MPVPEPESNPAPPPPGLPLRLGFAALLGVAALVCAVHGAALDQITDADRLKVLAKDRFEATQKLRRRLPIDDVDRAALQWRPGQPPPPGEPSWPWYTAAGGLTVASAGLLASWVRLRRRQQPQIAPDSGRPPLR